MGMTTTGGSTWRGAASAVLAAWDVMGKRHMSLNAAGVAFYGMFAVFPAMAATVALWGFFFDPQVMDDMLREMHGVIPDAAYTILASQLKALLRTSGSTLGWTTAVSMAVALYSVNNGVGALMTGVNAAQGRDHRHGLSRMIVSTLMTLGLVAMALMALAVVVAVPIVLNFMRLGRMEAVILQAVPWTVLFGMVVLVLAVFYRFGPNPRGGAPVALWPGAALAAVLWVIASWGFSLYLTYFDSYNRIYGSIGAVVALLSWFYISAYVVLLGAVLNAVVGQRRRD